MDLFRNLFQENETISNNFNQLSHAKVFLLPRAVEADTDADAVTDADTDADTNADTDADAEVDADVTIVTIKTIKTKQLSRTPFGLEKASDLNP